MNKKEFRAWVNTTARVKTYELPLEKPRDTSDLRAHDPVMADKVDAVYKAAIELRDYAANKLEGK